MSDSTKSILALVESQRQEIAELKAALTKIHLWGPMTVDDQRWLIAKAALKASKL